MFKLIVLGFSAFGTNGQPIVLNDVSYGYSSHGYEQLYFKDEKSCIEQGQLYVDATQEDTSRPLNIRFICVEIKK